MISLTLRLSGLSLSRKSGLGARGYVADRLNLSAFDVRQFDQRGSRCLANSHSSQVLYATIERWRIAPAKITRGNSGDASAKSNLFELLSYC